MGDSTMVLPSSDGISKPNLSRRPIAFISGHMDLTPEQFSEHYEPQLELALAHGHEFVVGDAKGLDGVALSYLLAQKSKHPDILQLVTVHCSRPGNVDKFKAMGVRTECIVERYDKKDPRARHLNRDARMTQASNYDILWARTEAEERAFYGQKWRPRVSATELNRQRRLETKRQADKGGLSNGGEGLPHPAQKSHTT